MAKRNSRARALAALDAANVQTAFNQARMGGYQGAPGTTPNPSGLVYPPTQTGGLPRDPRVFEQGSFGPLDPIVPMPIDVPDEDGDVEPRRFEYKPGYNMPTGVPGSESKMVQFGTLRGIADAYSVLRACISFRKNEILGLDWDIGPTAEAARQMRGDKEAYREFNERRAKMLAFWRRPDPNYHDMSAWLKSLLEDVFVTDALALYLHPPRVPGKGVCGTNLAALDLLDGTTIRPLVDLRGGSPAPPSPAYQQYLWGVPRVDLMDLITEADVADMGEAKVAEYSGKQLLYMCYTPRDFTMYGFSAVEQAFLPSMAGLAKQQYALQWFDDSSIPGVYFDPGPNITSPAQIAALQHALNAISGDLGWKHKIIVTPPGAKPTPMKPTQLADDFDQLVMGWVLQAFDIMPYELGIIMTRMTGSSAATPVSMGITGAAVEAHADIQKRKSTKPLLLWLKRALFDLIIRDVCGQADMEWKWEGLGENPMVKVIGRAQDYATLIATGVISIDEVRDELNLVPWGKEDTMDPVFVSPATGPMLWSEAAESNIVTAHIEALTAEAQARATEDTERTNQLRQTRLESTSSGGSSNLADPKQEGRNQRTEARPGGRSETPSHAGARPDTVHDRPRPKSLEPELTFSPARERAALVEFDLAKRLVKKGKRLTDFQPEDIPGEIWAEVLATYQASTKALESSATQSLEDALAAIERGIDSTTGWAHLQNREAAISLQMNSITVPLAVDLRKLTRGKITEKEFVDESLKAIAAACNTIVQAASNAVLRKADIAYSDLTPDQQKGWDAVLTHVTRSRTNYQKPFLSKWAKEVRDDPHGKIVPRARQRINLYGRLLQGAYEETYGLLTKYIHSLGVSKVYPAADELVITWHTREDPAVCFPAGQMVATPSGEKPIQEVAVGDYVLTPLGSRRVSRTFRREYHEGFVVIASERGSFVATANHPVSVNGTWDRADAVSVGDVLQTVDQESLKVNGILHFSSSQANGSPAELTQALVAAGVFSSVSMPVFPVNLKVDTAYNEVSDIAGLRDAELVAEVDAEILQSLQNFDLDVGGASMRQVAVSGTKFADSDLGGSSPDSFATVLADDISGGPVASFRTKAVSGSQRGEVFSTPGTGDSRARCGSLALLRAEGSLAFLAFGDHESLAATATSDMALSSHVSALLGTESLAAQGSEDFATEYAVLIGPTALANAIAGCTTELSGRASGYSLEALTALLTDIGEGHPVEVYNLEVEEAHTYYVEGVLVHNCNQCAPRDNETYTMKTLPGFPGMGSFGGLCDGGPNCRCFLTYSTTIPAKSET